MTPQTILITGATSGIGRAAALALARRGHRVFATGRREERLRALEQEGRGIEGIALDVTDAASIAQVKAEIDRRTEGRGVDVLINNAGYGQPGPQEMVTDAEVRAQYETNVFGVLAMTRAFLPQMRERRSGRIIHVGSVVGVFAFPLFGIYSSTKFAIEGLTDALRREVRPFGVKVTLIQPGYITTEFDERSAEAAAAHWSGESPYSAQIQKMNTVREKQRRNHRSPEIVVRAIVDAVESPRPPRRRMVPWQDRWGIRLLRWMPAWMADAVIARLTRVTPGEG
jgi:NAD(P)-dependent dehydrogenase (short-subunit alcohol dehydrogenase family)